MEGVVVLISVVMLTYNRQNFVRKAIESVLAQTYHDFEFIIIDNGSTDNSGKIADEYADKTKVKIVHCARGTIGAGRNRGIDLSNKEWVAFVDDDDYVEKDYLDFLMALAIENSADIAICGTTYMFCDEKMLLNAEKSIIELLWRKHYNNGFPAKLFKRRLFDGLRFPETERYEDVYLMYRIIAKANRVAYHGVPKYNVIRHSGNNSAATTIDGQITAQYIADYRRAYEKRKHWLCRYYPDNTEYWNYFNWSFQISMIHKIITNNISSCNNHLEEMRRQLKIHREEFLNCKWLQNFERNWLENYIK